MILGKRSVALIMVITDDKNKITEKSMFSWPGKEFMDCASTTFRGGLFHSLMVLGKNECN